MVGGKPWTVEELAILTDFMRNTRSIKRLLPDRTVNAIHLKMFELRSRGAASRCAQAQAAGTVTSLKRLKSDEAEPGST